MLKSQEDMIKNCWLTPLLALKHSFTSFYSRLHKLDFAQKIITHIIYFQHWKKSFPLPMYTEVITVNIQYSGPTPLSNAIFHSLQIQSIINLTQIFIISPVTSSLAAAFSFLSLSTHLIFSSPLTDSPKK